MPSNSGASQHSSGEGVHAPPKHTNRLSKETSPYLLQHQHNPVDWYAWGPEAFETARAQKKPIFLSIGYSTCYWCHVMERESFESEETAALMNEHFINIKVDREERPDVDDIYMTAVQLLNQGQGGWPMSVFLEPATLKPFLAGTYFPPKDAFGRPSFQTVLRQVSNFWSTQREAVNTQAQRVAEAIVEQYAAEAEPKPLSAAQVQDAIAALMASYDNEDGGFVGHAQRAPKFPTPPYLDFLIGAAWNNTAARNATTHTLDRMAMGGMYDQIGGGFHRYSVDEKWLVPHFEKMLYDNGQLASTYARAHELTRDAYYAQIVRETLDYVLREMVDDGGAFFSAQDAEVNAREGANYIWNEQELRDALTQAGLADQIDFALRIYGFESGPNFRDPHHPGEEAKNVVHLADKPVNLVRSMGMTVDQFNQRRKRIDEALLAVRDQRQQPATDDKVLVAWNGLMIAGMAEGGRVLKEKRYVEAGARAADFILNKMRTPQGELRRSYRGAAGQGQVKIDAFLEDYAMFIKGLIALHRATGEKRWLDEARALAAIAKNNFWDQSSGGYFDTKQSQSDLFVRIKSTHDGAIPCGNSIMLHNLLDLHDAGGDGALLDDAAATLRALSAVITERPSGAILCTLALHRMLQKHPQRVQQPATAAAAAPTDAAKPKTERSGAAGGGRFGMTRTDPVQVSASTNEVTVKRDAPASFTVTITVKKPYHINSNKPGEEFLIPLSITLSGAQGLKLVVDYPAGEAHKTELAEQPVYFHSGTVTIPVRVEQTGPVSGTPVLNITYQTCTDTECLEPKRERLPVRIIAQK